MGSILVFEISTQAQTFKKAFVFQSMKETTTTTKNLLSIQISSPKSLPDFPTYIHLYFAHSSAQP